MATNAVRIRRTRNNTPVEPTVVYHGIKIAPISGKRSAVALSLRDALKQKSEQPRGKPASA